MPETLKKEFECVFRKCKILEGNFMEQKQNPISFETIYCQADKLKNKRFIK